MRTSAWIGLGVGLAVVGLVANHLLLREKSPPAVSGPKTQLSVEMTLDKSVYAEAERVRATVRVANMGLLPARAVVVDCGRDGSGAAEVNTTFLAENEDRVRLDARDIGDILPGETRGHTASGVVSPSAHNVGIAAVVCAVRSPNATNPVVIQAAATVTGATNTVRGRFTICENDRHDRGAAGMTLTLERIVDDYEQAPLSAVTDADGRFAFPAAPAGPYQLSYAPPAGLTYNNPDVGRFIQVLVAGDEIRWETEELSVTTTGPETTCS